MWLHKVMILGWENVFASPCLARLHFPSQKKSSCLDGRQGGRVGGWLGGCDGM